MAWTDPADWPVGKLVDAAFMNTHVRDNLEYLYDAPSCQLTHSTTQSAGSGGEIHVDFDTEVKDPDNMRPTSPDDRIYFSRTGLWWLSATVKFSSMPAGTHAWLRVGYLMRAADDIGGTGQYGASVGGTDYYTNTENTTCQVNHHSGSAETLDADPEYAVQWLHGG